MTFDTAAIRFALYLFIVILSLVSAEKKDTLRLIERVNDLKALKKLLRTRTNVLVFFSNGPESSPTLKTRLSLLGATAEKAYGKGVIAFVNCASDEGKKTCKKLKATDAPSLKHFHNGEFHKNYDRPETVASMYRFLMDPTGDAPWEEDTSAVDVLHFDDGNAMRKFMKKEPLPILVMFYAPWCGHCKSLKPEYAEAATALKGEAVLAAMDVNRPENSDVQQQYDIKGFPTLLYFQHGKMKHPYGGENNKDSIIEWMKDPKPPKKENAKKTDDTPWSEQQNDVSRGNGTRGTRSFSP